MSNDKQSSVVDWIFSQLPDEYTTTRSGFDVYEQAKIIHELQITSAYKAAMHTQYLESHTVTRYGSVLKADDYYNKTYGDGEIKKNGSNNSTTANTTGTTFLCTEFVSDQLFYKGTLPHCIRCGKAQYQHPIISNT